MSDDEKIPWAVARDTLSPEELERAAGEGRISWADPERDAGAAVDEAAAWAMMRDALNTLERLGVLLGPVDIPLRPGGVVWDPDRRQWGLREGENSRSGYDDGVS